MKVILLKELKGRGGEGDVIEVANGYANNYLLTQGYAIKATKGNLKQLEQRKHNIAKREETRLADAEAMRTKLDGATVKVLANVGEEGQLFGSVTSSIVADAIKENLGVEVDRRRVELGNPIKVARRAPCCRYLHLSRHQGHRYRECRERQGCRGSGRGRGCRGSRRGSSCSC